MNKVPIGLIFCFCAWIACNPGNHGKKLFHAEQSDSVGSNDSTGESGFGADTVDPGMWSLKTMPKISLEQALSQVWRTDDGELAIFPDRRATLNTIKSIQLGTWSVNKSTRELKIRFRDGFIRTFVIRKIAVKYMELVMQGDNGPISTSLSADALVHRRPEEDPFYFSNCLWRIKPKDPETLGEIQLRLRRYCHFLALYFWDNVKRHASDIQFSHLPNCFIWYNGGIGMHEEADLDPNWIACFYNKVQAVQAREQLADLLQSHTLKWSENSTSWIMQTADVLDQMEKRF